MNCLKSTKKSYTVKPVLGPHFEGMFMAKPLKFLLSCGVNSREPTLFVCGKLCAVLYLHFNDISWIR